MLSRKPLVVVGVTAALGALTAACSSHPAATSFAEAGSGVAVPACTAGGLTVAFNPMYSAYDGKHMFQLPAIVNGSPGQVTWSADSSMVGMEPNNEYPNGVMITMLKAGTVTINLQSDDGKCGSAQLNITDAKESDWEIGSARYNNGKSLHLSGAGAGSPFDVGDAGAACTTCHGITATTSAFVDVGHTPEQTGGFSDQELIDIVVKGQVPDGGYFDKTIVPYNAWHNFHQWIDISPDQQPGMVVYLRSLTPASQKGQPNFTSHLDGG